MTVARHHHFILVDRKVQKATLHEWAAFFEKSADRTVARTEVDGFLVSTVFLGLDHNYSDDGPPILWETMVFGGNTARHADLDQSRCAGTWEQAEEMHWRAVRALQQAIGIEPATASSSPSALSKNAPTPETPGAPEQVDTGHAPGDAGGGGSE